MFLFTLVTSYSHVLFVIVYVLLTSWIPQPLARPLQTFRSSRESRGPCKTSRFPRAQLVWRSPDRTKKVKMYFKNRI